MQLIKGCQDFVYSQGNLYCLSTLFTKLVCRSSIVRNISVKSITFKLRQLNQSRVKFEMKSDLNQLLIDFFYLNWSSDFKLLQQF